MQLARVLSWPSFTNLSERGDGARDWRGGGGGGGRRKGGIGVRFRLCLLCRHQKMSDRAFGRTQNTDFGSIFVPERYCTPSLLKVNRHLSDRFL